MVEIMLDQLRNRAVQILAETHFCTLATTGPAGLQASMVRCAGRGTALYLLVPDTSDHLFNLESEPVVAVTTTGWHLRGRAAIVTGGQECAHLFSGDQRQWHTAVRVSPLRLHILPADAPAHPAETIDFDDLSQE